MQIEVNLFHGTGWCNCSCCSFEFSVSQQDKKMLLWNIQKKQNKLMMWQYQTGLRERLPRKLKKITTTYAILPGGSYICDAAATTHLSKLLLQKGRKTARSPKPARSIGSSWWFEETHFDEGTNVDTSIRICFEVDPNLCHRFQINPKPGFIGSLTRVYWIFPHPECPDINAT